MPSSIAIGSGRAWRERLSSAGIDALYLHVPFCARKCAYCDFASWATTRGDVLPRRYAEALERQVEQVSHLGLLDGCETAYVGGGTPTLLGEALGGLVRCVMECAPGIRELTCEANPDSLSDNVLREVAAAGCTRLSIGVQSLCDSELSELDRLHDAERARERVAAAVGGGLDVSCDLMCAIPLQTSDSWQATLEGVASLGVGHVSVYPLQIEDGTALAQKVGDEQPSWNSSDTLAARMEQAQSVLEDCGYRRYEVASYARLPEKECSHNKMYWTGRPYLGLGTGAASMLTAEGYKRLLEACPQLGPLPEGMTRARLRVVSGRDQIAANGRLSSLAFEEEFLTERQAAAEDLMLGARLACGLDAGLVAYTHDLLGESVDKTLNRLVREGFLSDALTPTQRGWLLGNELYGELWDLAGDTETLTRRSA